MSASSRAVVSFKRDALQFNFHTRPLGGKLADGAYLSVSELYRPDTYVPNVVSRAVDSYKARKLGRPFIALSVGCSFGVEVDTVLSEITKNTPEIGRAVIRGYDIHPGILEQARAAAYDIRTSDNTKLLDQFELSPRSPREREVVNSDERLYVADSKALREKHDVGFAAINLAEKQTSDEVPAADLVLCNHVLEHMNFTQIDPLVRGMVERVGSGGLLSVGTWSNHEENRTADLIQDLGLEPRLWYDGISGEKPFVFQRPSY